MSKIVGKTKSTIETTSADLREAFAMSQQQRNTPMKHILFTAALTATVLATGPVFAQTAAPAAPADATATAPIDTDTFLRMVLSSNDWEIQSSELAKAKTNNTSVVQFADMIIQDHTAAAAKLKETLEKKEEAPEGLPPAALTPKHQSMLQQLGAVTDGADFDKLYTDMQVQAHQEAIALFRSYASSGQDQALAGFAKETLPTLEKHLAEVEKLTGAN
jgi:putative membrane protein